MSLSIYRTIQSTGKTIQSLQIPVLRPMRHKYRGAWESFICYAMRTAPEKWADGMETGVTVTGSCRDMVACGLD
jgi:hypothetical protein